MPSKKENHYKRGWQDARHGHPPAQATEDYIRGYRDSLDKLKAYIPKYW